MQIEITITDAPDGLDTHALARGLADRAQYAFAKLDSVTFSDTAVTIKGDGRVDEGANDMGIF